MQLQIISDDPPLIFVRVSPPERQEFARKLSELGENEMTFSSNKGRVRFALSNSVSAEARDLSDIRIEITSDILQYLVHSIENHALKEGFHPFSCGLNELGASIRPRGRNVVIQATSFYDVTTKGRAGRLL